MARIAPEVLDLTAGEPHERAILPAALRGLNKRPASPSGQHSSFHSKRLKDVTHTDAPVPVPIPNSRRPHKRTLDAEERLLHGAVDRALQASELENSLNSLSGALRWRSPVKPHKLARLGEGLPGRRTAVRGIVDVDEEGGQTGQLSPPSHQQQQQQQAPGCRRSSGGSASARAAAGGALPIGSTGAGPAATKQKLQNATGGNGTSAAPAQAPPTQPQQQPEWGALFTALSLGGGGGRSSQRADPIWAAASMNRGGGGGAGAAGGGIGAGGRRAGVMQDAVPAATTLGAPARTSAPAQPQQPAIAPSGLGSGASWRRNLSTSSGTTTAPTAHAHLAAAALGHGDSLAARARAAAAPQSDGAMEEDPSGEPSRGAAPSIAAGTGTQDARGATIATVGAPGTVCGLDAEMAVGEEDQGGGALPSTVSAAAAAAASVPARPRGSFLMSEFNRLRAFGAGPPAMLG